MPFWQVGQLNSWKGTYHVAGQNSDVIEVRRSPTAPSAPTSFTPELFFTSPLPLTLPISRRLPPLLLAAASCRRRRRLPVALCSSPHAPRTHLTGRCLPPQVPMASGEVAYLWSADLWHSADARNGSKGGENTQAGPRPANEWLMVNSFCRSGPTAAGSSGHAGLFLVCSGLAVLGAAGVGRGRGEPAFP